MRKIILLGDSFSSFITYDEKTRKTRKANNSKLYHLSSLGAKIYNLSSVGITTDMAKEIIDKNKRIIKNSSVILAFGLSDSAYNFDEIAYTPNGYLYPKNSIETFKKEYTQIINIIRELGGIPLISIPFIQNGEKFKNMLTRHGVSEFTVPREAIEKLYSIRYSYKEAAIDIAKDMDVNIIDVQSSLLSSGDIDSYISYDGIHLTDIGYGLWEYEIYRFFLNERPQKSIKKRVCLA